MGSSFSVSTIFIGKDRMSPVFNKMGKAAGGFGNIVKGILSAQLIQRGITALTSGMREVTTQFINFDQTIVGATSRFKDLEIGTEQTNTIMLQLKKTARDVGATTQFTATEAAAGLNFFAKAGFTSAESMAVLKSQVDLATVAEKDFATTADITSDLLGAFGLNAQDSALKIANLKSLTNSLGLATNMANVDLVDLFETLKTAAPIATAAGEKMNPLISMTAALGSAGIKGSMGATAIKNAYLNLATNAPNVSKALDSIGLSQKDFVDQKTGTIDMIKAMSLLGDATKNMGNVEQLSIFSEIFGKRAVAGAINISKSLQDISNINAALEGGKNISDIADQIRTGLGMQIKILKSGLLELGFRFVEAFEQNGRGALSKLISIVQTFDVQPIIHVVKTLVNIFKLAAKTAFDLSKQLFSGLIPSGNQVVSAFDIFAKVLTIAIKVIGAILRPVVTLVRFLRPLILIIFAAIAAYKAWIIVQTIINVVMSANPISLIIIGIAALIVGIIALVQHWDKVKAALIAAWEWIVNVWDTIKGLTFFLGGPVIGAFTMVIEVIRSVVSSWNDIKSAFTDGGFLAGIKAIGMAILSGILAPVESLLELISKIPGVGKLTAGLTQKVTDLRNSLNNIGEKNNEAPNRSEVEARQRAEWTGQLNIAGAPTGSTFEQKSKGAPPLRYQMLGAN